MSDPEKVTIRYRAGIAQSGLVGVLCLVVAVMLATQVGALWTSGDPARFGLAMLMLVVVAGAGVGLLIAAVRTRLVVDADGVTAIGVRRHVRLAWSNITRWEAESGPRMWLIRAWCGDEPTVIARYRTTILPGRGTTYLPKVHPVPTPEAPQAVHYAFAVLTDTWRRHRAG